MANQPEHYKSWSDAQLMQGYQLQPREKLFTELYHRYAHLVYGVATKLVSDLDDPWLIVSNVFVKLQTQLQSAQNAPILSLQAWLYTVTRRESLSALQRKAIDRFTTYLEAVPDTRADLDPAFDTLEDEYKGLYQLLDSLSADQRTCLKMLYFEDFSYKEIAERLNIEVGTVRSHIQNGKRLLRKYLRAST